MTRYTFETDKDPKAVLVVASDGTVSGVEAAEQAEPAPGPAHGPAPDPIPDPIPDPRSWMGTNIEYVRYWTQHWVFKDRMRYAGAAGVDAKRGWIASPAGSVLDVDENGWIKSLASGQTARTYFPSHDGWPSVLLFAGSGSIRIDGGQITASAPGRIDFTCTPNAQLALLIVTTNPADPIRNLRCVRADDFAIAPFHPTFLDRIRPFGTIRCMDLGSTNYTTAIEWADRTRPDQFPQSGPNGIAWEHMIDLCNAADSDIWICVPHLASDDYVRQLAELIKARLSSQLRCWVEYSNELWNGMFAQSRWCQSQGVAAGLSTNSFQACLRFQSHRSKQIFRIFQEVMPLCRTVIGSQAGQGWAHDQLLGFEGLAEQTTALAIAPYFGSIRADLAAQFERDALANGVDWVIDQLENVEMPAALERARVSEERAANYGVDLVAYEGGQHLVPLPTSQGNTALVELYATVNRHPRMGEIYRKYFSGWRTLGGREFMNFSFCDPYGRFGSFPMMERQDQPIEELHKYRAVVEASRLP